MTRLLLLLALPVAVLAPPVLSPEPPPSLEPLVSVWPEVPADFLNSWLQQ